jgi:hypothetical protein
MLAEDTLSVASFDAFAAHLFCKALGLEMDDVFPTILSVVRQCFTILDECANIFTCMAFAAL